MAVEEEREVVVDVLFLPLMRAVLETGVSSVK